MPFSSYPPSGPAAAFIESYWLVDDPDATPREQKIIPDGFPEIIFHYGDPYCIQLKSDWQLQSKRLLAGQVKQYFFLKNTGASGVLGIKCKPAAITALFGINMSDYTDKVVDLHAALGQRLNEVEHIACAALPAREKLKLIDDWFARQPCPGINETIQKAVTLIFKSKGLVTIDELCAQLYVTERSLERLFARYIGLPPKFYARIIRFNHIFSLVQEKKLTWTDVAAGSGYYDSSHFVKNFRAFTGEDPSAYAFDDENLANFFLLKKGR